MSYICISTPTQQELLKSEMKLSRTLTSLLVVIPHGWPDKRAECPSHLHAYWNYKDELTVADGLILKAHESSFPNHCNLPFSNSYIMATKGLKSVNCKLKAKGSVFWANINADIEQMVKGCGPCQRHQNMNVRDPRIPHDVPQRPWHTLGSNLFFWNTSAYLIVCDHFSKFPLIRKLSNIQSITTITHLRSSLKSMASQTSSSLEMTLNSPRLLSKT